MMAKLGFNLTSYDSAIAFRDRAQPFLMRQEAANNLMLGLTSNLIDAPWNYQEPPYLATVEVDGAVVFAALRTPPYRLIVSTTELPAASDLVADNLQVLATDLPGVTGLVDVARGFADAWETRTGATATEVRDLRIYAVGQVEPVNGVPGALRRATPEERERLVDWFVAFAAEIAAGADRERIAHGIDTRFDNPVGGLWFWEVEGAPVCLVGAGGVTPNGIRIGPVYTPPEHRRAGYASAATAAVSQLLLDSGRAFVFLFTDRSNATANHIYQTIGYEAVGDTVEIEFAPPAEAE